MKKKIIIVGIILLIIIGASSLYIIKTNNYSEDALKFKEEYESLNGTIRESDGATYQSVSIPKNNPIKYITVEEAIDIIKNKSGVILFGANWCPWCRNASPVLIDAAINNNLDTIYYLDMTDVRNTWKVIDGELVKTVDEEEGYYELLELLDSILGDENYTLTDSSDNVYDTGEKRISIPLVISVSDSEILSYHFGTVSFNDGQTKYDNLTDEQYDTLYNIYDNLIKSLTKVCSENCD